MILDIILTKFSPSFQGKVVTETTTEYKEAATGDDSGFSDFGPSFTSSSSPFQLKRETKVKKIRFWCLQKFCQHTYISSRSVLKMFTFMYKCKGNNYFPNCFFLFLYQQVLLHPDILIGL